MYILIVNNNFTYNFIIGDHLHGKSCTNTAHFLGHHQLTSTFRDIWIVIYYIKL